MKNSLIIGFERNNEKFYIDINKNKIFSHYIIKSDDFVIDLLNTGNHHNYTNIKYKNLNIYFDNNKLNRWTIYIDHYTNHIRKDNNVIYYGNNKYFGDSNINCLDDKQYAIQNNHTKAIDTDKIYNGYITKYLPLYNEISDTVSFKECITNLILSLKENNDKIEIQNFEELLINFINAEKDINNKNDIFNEDLLIEKYPKLDSIINKNLLNKAIEGVTSNIECYEYIFYNRDDVYQRILDKVEYLLNKQYIEEERKNKIKTFISEEYYDLFYKNYKNEKIINLTDDKEKRFIEYENGKIKLNKEDELEYTLIYKNIIQYYISMLYNKKTKKIKPVISALEKKENYTKQIINHLKINDVLQEETWQINY